MRKVYYNYNPRTRTYDRIYPTFKQRILSYLRRIFIGAGIGISVFIVLLWIFGSPLEKDLRVENSRLKAQYSVLSKRLDEALLVMGKLQQRDDNLYRVIFQTNRLPEELRIPNYAETNRYAELMDMANAKLVVQTSEKMDLLAHQLYVQSNSYDQILQLVKQHDKMLACIPAIQPVANKDLKQTASGYGTRIDPIYKTVKFHSGMDFSARTGTPVYATGDGTIVAAGRDGLYGICIQINHGFGYVTKYAHLSKIHVRKGQKVVRGQHIGAVGSTGKSTGSHLHYEVHVNGQIVNPVNYYFMDLNESDYARMIELAANHGNVYD